MSKHRPEAILDVYKLVLGVVLFVSPWLFAFAGGAAAMDARADGAAIAVASLAALLAFAEWEEWVVLLAGLWMVAVAFRPGVPAHDGDARQHRDRSRRFISRRARSLAHSLRAEGDGTGLSCRPRRRSSSPTSP
jgi:hypothetical protein